MPDGVTLQGTSLANTILTPDATALPDVVALSFAGSAQVSNLQIHGFKRGVVANNAGVVGLSNLHVYGNALDGVIAAGTASLLLGAVEIDTNGNAGVFLSGNASASLDNVNVHGNATGAYVSDGSQLNALLGTKFIGNGHVMGATNSGVFITGSAEREPGRRRGQQPHRRRLLREHRRALLGGHVFGQRHLDRVRAESTLQRHRALRRADRAATRRGQPTTTSTASSARPCTRSSR